jgi:hypothetical protein
MVSSNRENLPSSSRTNPVTRRCAVPFSSYAPRVITVHRGFSTMPMEIQPRIASAGVSMVTSRRRGH